MEREWGGPPVVVSNLIKYFNIDACEIDTWTTHSNMNMDEELIKDSNIQTFPRTIFHKVWKGHSFALKKKVRSNIDDYDLVHIHEMWNYPHYIVAKECIKKSIPYIISVHGGLNNYALKIKKYRKRIYSAFIQKYYFNKASLIHVFTNYEKKNVKEYNDSNNYLILPNGVQNPPLVFNDYKKIISDNYVNIGDKKIFLFCGRLHKIKGVNNLIDSFVSLSKEINNLFLIIIGSYDNSYGKYLIEKSKSNKNIIFTGFLTGKIKASFFQAADVFVLPSYSEGFSMSILEGLSYGIPVIITKECNFDEIEHNGAGLITKPGIKELKKSMKELIINDTHRLTMRKNAKELINKKYSWDKIIDQMWMAYQRVANINGDKYENIRY